MSPLDVLPAASAMPPTEFQPIIIDEFNAGIPGQTLYCSATPYGGRYWFAESNSSRSHYAFWPSGTITSRKGTTTLTRIQAAVEIGTYADSVYWHVDGRFKPSGTQQTQVGWSNTRLDWLMDSGHLQVNLTRSGHTTLRLGPHLPAPDPNILLEENLSEVPINPQDPAGMKLWVPGQEHGLSLRFDPTLGAEKVWFLIRDRNVIDLVDRFRGSPTPRQFIDVHDHPRVAAFKTALTGSPWVIIASVNEPGGIVDDGTVVNEIDVYTDGTLTTPPQDLPECAFGACCLLYACLEGVSQIACSGAAGTWRGSGSVCGDARCCPDPFADFDADGDVDMTDFAVWQRCFTGNSGAPIPADCGCLDWNDDGQIDMPIDYTAFVACARGPGVAADPICDGNGTGP